MLLLTAGCGAAAPVVPTLAAPTLSPSPFRASATATLADTSTPVPTPTRTPRPTASRTPTATALPPTATSTATAGTGLGDANYAPTVATVWNTTIGPDNMSGECSGSILPVYGLVQITPSGENLIWKSQEPAPYTFGRASFNRYVYSGPTALGDGTVMMNLTFTSPTAFQMTRTFTPNAEPNCTHMHLYTGTFQWVSP